MENKLTYMMMDYDFTKIKKLTRFMKKEGVSSLKLKDFEITVDLDFRREGKQIRSDLDAIAEKIPLSEALANEEQSLFWSAPGYSEGEITQ